MILFFKKTITKILFNLWYIVSIKKKESKYKLFQKFKIDTILDIWANYWQFLWEYLEIFPAASFHSFEPLPSAFAILKQNYWIKNNVSFYNIGLWSKTAIMHMNECEYAPSSSLLEMTDIHKKAFPYTAKSHEQTVDIKRLDDLSISGKNILVKIDTQWYEAEVIKWWKNLIKKSKICVIETSFVNLYSEQPLFSDIYDMMKDLWFMYAGSYDQILDINTWRILQQDALFINNN